MKKIFSILLLALALTLILASCEGNTEQPSGNEAEQQEQIKALEELIASLNKDIEALEKDVQDSQHIIDRQNAIIEALQQSVLNKDAWDEATQALVTYIQKIDAVTVDYENEIDENGYIVLDKSKYWDWDYCARDLMDQAINDLSRAVSIAQMDEIVAQYERDLRSIPTMVEELYALVDSIEAGGVTADDIKAINKIIDYDMLNCVDVSYFPGESPAEKAAAKEELCERFEKLFDEYKDAATAHFIEMVYELPDVDDVKISNKKAVRDAEGYLHYLCELGIEMSKGTAKKAVIKLEELYERIDILQCLKEEGENLNETIRTAFEGKKFLLDMATLDIIQSLEETVNALFYGSLIYYPGDPYYDAEDPARNKDGWEDLYDMVLDPEDADFNEYVYNFIDHKTLEGYRAKFESLREELNAVAEMFYQSVDAFDNAVTFGDWDYVEEQATKAYSTIITMVGLDQINHIDALLGNEPDEDTGLCKFESYKRAYAEFLSNYADILVRQKAIINYISKNVRDLVCTVDNHVTDMSVVLNAGQKYCDCSRADANAMFGDINAALVMNSLDEFRATVYVLKTLMSCYEFTAEEILGEYYSDYLEVAEMSLRIMAYEVIYAHGDEAGAINACKRLVDAALANGVVFEMEYIEDMNDNDIKDPAEYEWSGTTKALFEALAVACSIETYNSFVN